MEKEYYGCVYLTTNLINGKKYIGQSIKILQVMDGKYKGSGKLINRAFNKYGYNNFKCEIIEYIENDISLITKEEKLQLQDKLDEREKFFIIYYSTNHPTGYNIAEGGNRGGFLLKYASEEDKKNHGLKLSKANKGKTRSEEIKKSFRGRVFSEEHKRKISEAQRGERGNMFGKHFSQETRDKMSKSQTGRIHSEETKIKIGISNLGKVMSEEARKKISSSRKNIKISEEKKNPKITCPHCGKCGRNNIMPRYHFDKCKFLTRTPTL
jgi:group I intron endonuclease